MITPSSRAYLKTLLEKDPEKYREMLAKPILAQPAEKTLETYFSISDDVGGGKLKGTIREMLGVRL